MNSLINISSETFQSTLPRRERHVDSLICLPVVIISIHAPAKGATLFRAVCKIISSNFNPRSREGSDPRYLLIRIRSQYFNPRSREGSDIMVQITSVGIIISIHAPAKGATAAPPRQVGAPIRFQSTLPRRERPRVARRGRVGGAISIHAPAKGATHCVVFAPKSYFDFNPRSREGSDVL